MTTKLWGVNHPDLATVEAGLDQPLDLVRDYGWLGKTPPVEGLAASHRLFVSMKFRTNAATVSAADIASGKYDAQIVAWISWYMGLTPGPAGFGPHVLIPEHEIDAAAAAASGTPAQLNAAFLHVASLARQQPGWKGLIGCCTTGFDATDRDPLYAPSFGSADLVCFDQPYMNDNTFPQSAAGKIGPTVADFSTRFPGKDQYICEWGGARDADGSKRAAWFTAFGAALQTAQFDSVKGLIYFTNPPYGLTPGTVDFAAWQAARVAQQAPPTVTVLQSDYDKLLATQTAATTAMATLSDALVGPAT